MTTLEAMRIVRDVANLPIILHEARGRRRIVSFFEAAVRRIATGQVSRRTSPIQFVNLVLETAHAWPQDDPPPDSPSASLEGQGDGSGAMPAGGTVEYDVALTDLARPLATRARRSQA